jgi:GNAT superfamily N-acetyltransferase
MPDITVRKAGPGDAPDVVALIREMAREDGEHTPVAEAYVEARLGHPGSGVPLAEADGRRVGLLGYSLRPDLYHTAPACLIELLDVRHGERSRGAGGALADAVPAKAQALGCAEISVSVMPDNAGAIRFYRRHGLTEEAALLERRFVRSPGGAS